MNAPPKIERAPDLTGNGRAWLITATSDVPDHSATVRAYIVHAPQGNPHWPWYMIAGVHLREIVDVPPPIKHFVEASHEIVFCAISPDSYERVDPDNYHGIGWLEPIDLIHQVANLTDEQAAHVVEACVRAIVVGGHSPDQDHRRWWQVAIEHTAQHEREGRHA